MAYSLFTRDELPYLLDLHLLLSRPVTPAPAVPLLQAAQAASTLSASASTYGMAPQVHLSQGCSNMRVPLHASPACARSDLT